MATIDVIAYYANLLIIQYLGKPKAYATIQATVTPILMGTSDIQLLKFSADVSTGNWKLSYGGVDTASLSATASAGNIQTALNAILVSPLSVVVTGTMSDGFTIVFSNFTEEVDLLEVVDNTLNGSPIPFFSPIGPQLPLAVQDGFNLIGPDYAVGAQLDILGKYVGASRSGYGFNGPVSLDDADYLTLIQMAIIRNSAGSSLAAIQLYIHRFFGDEIFVFDYANMNMSYLINSSIGTQDLIELVVAQGFLPKPMGVGLSVIVNPVIDKFFAFRTYENAAWVNSTPFQTYADYNTDWLWLSYQMSVPI